jgi:hypothetical protein
MAVEDNVRNKDTVQGWINRWHPLAARAVHTFAALLEASLERTNAPPLQPAGEALDRYYRDYLELMNLEIPW